MGIVHQSKGKLTPASPDLLSEPAIVAGMAEATIGNTSCLNWAELRDNYDLVRERITKVIPGFESFNAKVRQPGGFYLPNSVKERVWETPSGKAEFSVAPLEQFELQDGHLLLQTLRSHDQYNTTIYGLNDRYRGIGMGRRIVFLNPEDLKERGIAPVSKVDLTSYWKNSKSGELETREAREFYAIPYDIPRGTAAAYFPETNVLVPIQSTAKESNTPTSKSIEISVTPST